MPRELLTVATSPQRCHKKSKAFSRGRGQSMQMSLSSRVVLNQNDGRGRGCSVAADLAGTRVPLRWALGKPALRLPLGEERAALGTGRSRRSRVKRAHGGLWGEGKQGAEDRAWRGETGGRRSGSWTRQAGGCWETTEPAGDGGTRRQVLSRLKGSQATAT